MYTQRDNESRMMMVMVKFTFPRSTFQLLFSFYLVFLLGGGLKCTCRHCNALKSQSKEMCYSYSYIVTTYLCIQLKKHVVVCMPRFCLSVQMLSI